MGDDGSDNGDRSVKIKDRIKKLARVRAGDLIPNERNWRTHSKAQKEALQGVLAEVGYADALIVYETDAGLKLIDGHLRAETTPDTLVPVLILDVNEDEANKLLLTLDPLAAMAGTDAQLLDSLLRDVQTGSEALASMLSDMAQSAGILKLGDPPESFPEKDDNIEVEHRCPKCGFEWSGSPT